MKIKLNFKFLLAVIFAIVYIFPFSLVLINSFKERVEIIANPLKLPAEFSLTNYITTYERMDYASAFFNSLIITVTAVIVLIIFPSMLAYYLVRFNYRRNQIIFIILIASMIIPFQALMIPFVSIYGKLDMLNSRLYLVYFYLGFGVALSTFMYHGFIKSIPMALDESATIEGANKFQIYRHIILPMLKPITATIVILNSLWIWNDFLLPSLALFQKSRTLPLSTFSFFGRFTTDFGLAMAGLVLSMLPIIILYLALQRQIISGISEGAVK